MRDEARSIEEGERATLADVMRRRAFSVVFQPIFGLLEGRMAGFEALVRGPAGTRLEAPLELFATARGAGVLVALNILCIQESLRAFARLSLEGALFLNVSPQLILQPGFDQARARRFLDDLGLGAARVVIELTEDHRAGDFRETREALMLYRAMGFRVAIDDLGEGFSSLRLWSELQPEYVKVDKHFVLGVARDPLKLQFLRAIQDIARNCGSLVIAEGIENAEDFRMAKGVGVACVQGWFIGRPAPSPLAALPEAAARANADTKLAVAPVPRLRFGCEPRAHHFLRTVEAVTPQESIAGVRSRFDAVPTLCALPVVGAAGIEGVIARAATRWLDLRPRPGTILERGCLEIADRLPLVVDAELELAALAAMLSGAGGRHLAAGFVITGRGGRYLGMGTSGDVMRSLQDSQLVAARYTNPLTLLPGPVPIDEHLDRLLAHPHRFSTWIVELEALRGLNDAAGHDRGDALIGATARLLESLCEPGVDFVGHAGGTRFVLLMQSDDWEARAEAAIRGFAPIVEAHVGEEAFGRGYFTARLRGGREAVRPLPRLGIGVLPVLPGVFESRREVLSAARQAAREALDCGTSAVRIDRRHANAYPASLLFAAP